MGQARIRGSFEARKQAAIEAGRVKGKHAGSRKHYYHDPFLGATVHGNEIMALSLATMALGSLRKWKRKNEF